MSWETKKLVYFGHMALKRFLQIIKKTLLSNWFWQFLFLISCIASAYLYRLGSARVDRGYEPGLRDLGTYISGGEAILLGENPYLNPWVRIGPSGLLFFSILNNLLGSWFFATLIQILTPICFTYFAFVLLELNKNPKFKLCYQILPVLPWISAVRENLVNIQITGIVAIGFAGGLALIKKRSKIWIAAIPIAFAIDTKPHLVLLPFVVFLVMERHKKLLIMTGTYIATVHLITSLWTDVWITKEWIWQLLGLYEKAEENQLAESIAIWPIVNQLGLTPFFSTKLSSLIFVVLTLKLLSVARKKSQTQLYSIALVIPSFGVFFHYYDLAPTVILIVFALITANKVKTLQYILGLIIIPENFLDRSALILLMLTLGYLTFAINNFRVSVCIILRIFCSWLIYAIVTSFLGQHFGIHAVAMTIQIVILSYLAFVSLKT
jgi:hypothetical protein